MIYLLIALINIIYGLLLFRSITLATPGYLIIIAVGAILIILGIIGIIYWIKMITNPNADDLDKEQPIKNWLRLAISFDIVLVIGTLFRILVLQPYMVEGDSMENNFHNEETLLVDKISYKFHNPQRSDVIIFVAPQNPKDDYIKRIIGLPGDTFSIKNSKVYINDELLQEPYLADNIVTNFSKSGISQIKLQDGEYFVLGDNRTNSSDSREWGVVPKNNIIGKAWLVVYPFDNIGLVRYPSSTLPAPY